MNTSIVKKGFEVEVSGQGYISVKETKTRYYVELTLPSGLNSVFLTYDEFRALCELQYYLEVKPTSERTKSNEEDLPY